jgi:hypothetical protein
MKARDVLPLILTGTTLGVIAGAGYILDCRTNGGPVQECWLTGLPIMGLGAGAGAGFRVGYETLNPALRRRDEDRS